MIKKLLVFNFLWRLDFINKFNINNAQINQGIIQREAPNDLSRKTKQKNVLEITRRHFAL